MKHIFLSVVFLSMLTAQAVEISKETPVTAIVKANSLNIRVKANTKSTILSQVFRDNILKVVAVQGKWAEVEVPRSAQVWVETKGLENGIVIHNDTPIYAGPAIQYDQVGDLAKGEVVKKILGSERWWQITTSSKMYAWVSVEYLEFSKKKALKTEDPNKIPGDVVDIEGGVVALLDDKADLKQKKVVSKSPQNNLIGIVTPLKNPLNELATHALMIKIGDEYHTTCYLRSNIIKLENWIGKSVVIDGKNELVLGWQRPIVVVSSIKEQKAKKSRLKK
ncbi:MAG: hypothetical protein KAG98_01460 [Lentisphaeria bacterium]|nr:hypothetical protein [Lentisphaeria bacterium]